MKKKLFKLCTYSIIQLCLLYIPKTYSSLTLNLTKGSTVLSEKIYRLHMITFWICLSIGVLVFSILIFSIIFFRKSRGAVSSDFHENTKLEIMWIVIPIVILIIIAVPATKILMEIEDTKKSDLSIKIVGHQWDWEYKYIDQDISFFSHLKTPYNQIYNKEKKNINYLLEVDNVLVLPIKKKIRFLITSSDVIHSWWVPELGIKKDAIPGFINESWAYIKKKGTYRGQCAELCGINHAYMPIVVKAVSYNEYKDWLKKKLKNENKKINLEIKKKRIIKIGEVVYKKYCSACHMDNGKGIQNLYPKLKGSSIVTGTPKKRVIEILLNGIPNTAMKGYRKRLSNIEIAAVITYIKNSWDNNTDDIVQPYEIY